VVFIPFHASGRKSVFVQSMVHAVPNVVDRIEQRSVKVKYA